MKLSIIIPSYNEETTIAEIIKKVKKQKVQKIKKEIIVIDDGSTDKTYEILKKIKGITLLKHDKNIGKGFAIRTGLKKVTGKIILIQDADLELSPEDYPSLLKPIIENKAKVVYGSRFLTSKKAKHNFCGYLGRIGRRLITHITNFLYGTKITDESIGYKVFKTEVLKSIDLKCKGFEFCPEVTAKLAKRKIKIKEVPVRYNPRTKKQGKKLRWVDGIKAIWTLIKERLKNEGVMDWDFRKIYK